MSWEQRVNGLQFLTTGSVSQWAAETLIWDPWWFTEFRKNTYNPEQVILHTGGLGFLAVSEDAGKNWDDRTAYVEQNGPPNSWGDTPAPTMNDVSIKQIHGDIHKLGRFCAIGHLATGTATDARGWLMITDNDWFTTEWTGLANVNYDGTYLYPIGAKLVCSGAVTGFQPGCYVEHDVSNAVAAPDGATAYWVKTSVSSCPECSNSNNDLHAFFDFGVAITNGTFEIRTRGTHDVNSQQVRYSNTQSVYDSVTRDSIGTGPWFDEGGDSETWYGGDATLTWYSNGGLSSGNPWQFIRYRLHSIFADPVGVEAHIDTARVQGTFTLPPVAPLALDVDNETGLRCYVTAWHDGILTLQNWDVTTTTPALNSSYTLDTVTISEIEQFTKYAVPFCLADLNVSGYGDVVYVFGFFAGSHIVKTTDGGATFGGNLGDASWGTNRVSAFMALDENTFYAFVKTATSQSDLWRSLDGGATWVKIQSALPVAPEHQAISRHASGALLVGNSDVGSVGALVLLDNYEGQYIDATGPAGSRLPNVPGDGGGGLSSIIWVT